VGEGLGWGGGIFLSLLPGFVVDAVLFVAYLGCFLFCCWFCFRSLFGHVLRFGKTAIASGLRGQAIAVLAVQAVSPPRRAQPWGVSGGFAGSAV
jgi:O-antigen/teichoic acid export membrane protein